MTGGGPCHRYASIGEVGEAYHDLTACHVNHKEDDNDINSSEGAWRSALARGISESHAYQSKSSAVNIEFYRSQGLVVMLRYQGHHHNKYNR